jgi:hypothetical protein
MAADAISSNDITIVLERRNYECAAPMGHNLSNI